MSFKFTILGCGNSTGVPTIGNYWGKCDAGEPKNRRTRSSLLVQSADTTLVIDTGPDFKEQINRTDVQALDAVLYTHGHSDHVNGIDELRVIRHKLGHLVPIYGNADTIGELKHRFSHILDGGKGTLYPPLVEPYAYKDSDYGAVQRIGDIDYIPFIQDHDTCESVGYRFGDLGYGVDMLRLDERSVEVLKGVKTWIVDCAGFGKYDYVAHANFETVQELNEKIGAQTVYLSSLGTGLDYNWLLSELPDGYEPAYDGLIIENA